MFCHKCGNKSPEGATFCQKCGAKLIQDEGASKVPVETITVPEPISAKVPSQSTEPVLTEAQESVAPKLNAPASEETVDISKLLKENMARCPVIKSVTQEKKGAILRGAVCKYLILIAASSQAVIVPSLAFPFIILDWIAYGFIAIIAANIGWNFMENGSIHFEDCAFLLAFGLLAGGLIKTITPFLGLKEKEAVSTYVSDVVQPEGITVASGMVKTRVSAIRLAASIVPALAGVIILIFVMIDNFGFGGNREVPVTALDDSTPDIIENVSLVQTYVNEKEGFSFKYPSSWEQLNEIDFKERKKMVGNSLILEIYALDYSGHENDYYAPYMQVLKRPVNLSFDGTKDDFQNSLSLTMNEVNVTELTDIDLNGFPARKLSYLFNDNGKTCSVIEYYYVIDDNMYGIRFYSSQKSFDNLVPTFNAILESYTITAASTSGENGSGSPNTADVYFEGVSLSQLLYLTTDEVIALLGPPEVHDEYKLAYDTIEFDLYGGRITGAESFYPEKFLISGTPLAQNRSLLPALLGEPTYEGEGGSGYEMTFEQNGYVLTIATGDKDGAAWRIFMTPNVETADNSGGEILYKGHPVAQLLGSTPEELNKIFGDPTDTGFLYGATEYYTYSDVSFMLDDQGTVFNIIASADAIEVNGTTLNLNRAGIINLLGTPWNEKQLPEDEAGEGFGGYYVMEYTVYDGGIITTTTIKLPDAGSIANQVVFSQYIDGAGDEEYQQQSNSIDSYSPLTADGNTLSVGSLVYAKQNVFGVSVNYVRGYVTSIDDAGSVSVQWDTLLENRLWAFDECAILSDSTSPTGYSYYSSASGKQIPLTGVKFNLSANELYSKIP